MWKNAVVVVAVVAMMLSVAHVRAHCGGCAKKAETVEKCEAKACPVGAALAKMDLTDAQKKEIAAAQEECAAACTKAGEIKCPKGCAKAKIGAKKACMEKIKGILTEEQVKALDAAIPAKKSCGAAACPSKK